MKKITGDLIKYYIVLAYHKKPLTINNEVMTLL